MLIKIIETFFFVKQMNFKSTRLREKRIFFIHFHNKLSCSILSWWGLRFNRAKGRVLGIEKSKRVMSGGGHYLKLRFTKDGETFDHEAYLSKKQIFFGSQTSHLYKVT